MKKSMEMVEMANINNTEIERKFLVKNVPFELDDYEVHNIYQGYIATNPTMRLRKDNDRYIFTFKGKGLIKKTEFEYELDEEQFARLWKKVESNKIVKKRYIIPIEKGLKAELDIYEDFLEGFMTVEVEFSSMEEALVFQPPEWFGKDVSNDRRYSNASLAINGKVGKN